MGYSPIVKSVKDAVLPETPSRVPTSCATKKSHFGLEALDAPLQVADQPDRLAIQPVMAAKLLESSDLEERGVVKPRLRALLREFFSEDSKVAIIAEHLRVQSGQLGGVFEGVSFGLNLDRAEENQGT